MYKNTQDPYTWTTTFFREEKEDKQYITSKIPPNADPIEALDDMKRIIEENFGNVSSIRICIHYEELDYNNPEWSCKKEFSKPHTMKDSYEKFRKHLFHEEMPKFNTE